MSTLVNVLFREKQCIRYSFIPISILFISLFCLSASGFQPNVKTFPTLGKQKSKKQNALSKVHINEFKKRGNQKLSKSSFNNVDEITGAELSKVLNNIGSELKIKRVDTDKFGNTHVRMTQYFRNDEVVDGEIIVHADKNGTIFRVDGNLLKKELKKSIKKSISIKKAEAISLNSLREHDKYANVTSSRYVVYNGKKCVEVIVQGKSDIPTKWICLIDGETEELLFGYNSINYAAPTDLGTHENVTGITLADEGATTVTFEGWHDDGGNYFLYNKNSNWGVYDEDAVDWEQQALNDWGVNDPAALSLGYNINIVQQYVTTVLGLNSYDNAGAFCRNNVHVGNNYVNAYWDGSTLNFGDGDGVTANSLAVLDIVGHEFGHAITTNSSALVYSYESGALNEAYSDILGTLIEFYAQVDGSSSYPLGIDGQADWLCGEDAWLSGEALRDLRDPNRFSQPSYYNGSYWYSGSGDNGGVHTNSGVANYAFYLLAEGGVGTNDGHAYDITGIGVEASGEIAMYANIYLHTANDEYQQAREKWIEAARILGYDTLIVADVWSACGVLPLEKHLSVNTTEITFGAVGINTTKTVNLVISNNGTDVTTISSIYVNNLLFTLGTDTSNITINPGSSITTLVSFSPLEFTNETAVLTILSDAIDNPSIEVALSGEGVEPALAEITPVAINIELDSSASFIEIINIANQGVADLDFSTELEDVTVTYNAIANNEVEYDESHFLFLEKGEEDYREGVAVNGLQGGPDQFGYKWIDSDSPSGPVFAWNSINAPANLLSNLSSCDDCNEGVPLSFEFEFYGTTFNQVFVSTNGFVTLGTGSSQYGNYPIPSTSNPANLIAGFMDDLNPYNSGNIYFEDQGDKAIIQYDNVSPYSGSGTFTYQIVLNRDGVINFYYQDMNGSLVSSTVGIQNGTRDDGLSITYNSSYIHDGLAVEIRSTPEWFTVAPESGTVLSNGNQNLDVTLEPSGLVPGQYNGNILINHNATNIASPFVVPVSMLVTVSTSMPEIVTQPVDQTIEAGNPVTFSVDASGGNLAYQWYRDGIELINENGSSLTINTVEADNGAQFHCVVSNEVGTVTSNTVILTVTIPVLLPEITTQPVDQIIEEGQAVTFSITATGSDLSYQWYRDSVAIVGEISNILTFTANLSDDGSSYRCVVTNSAGSVTSAVAFLTVSAIVVAPEITTQPVDQVIEEGQAVTFSISATGSDLSYQWYRDSVAIVGEISNILTFTTNLSDNGSSYRCVVTNSAGSVTSAVAFLTVSAIVVAPEITTQPMDQVVEEGQAVTFSVTATGTSLKYQWLKDGVAISGEVSNTLTFITALSDDGSQYSCVVSNSAGSVTSAVASLTVTSIVVAPEITTQPVDQVVEEGQAVTFSVIATGTDLEYQWLKDGVAISGEVSNTLTFTTALSDDGSQYSCEVSNSAGSVTSAVASLTVTIVVAPEITAQPVDQTVEEGQAVTFSVTATGTDLEYQWYRDGIAITGELTNSITMTTTFADSGSVFICSVSNSAGSVESSPAILSVTRISQYEEWDSAQAWYTYSVGDIRTNANKIWRCVNIAWSYLEPSSPWGHYGWEYIGDL